MCTLTAVVPSREERPSTGSPPLLRVAFNRDELRSRPNSHPPELRTAGDRRAVYPIDGESGGTWIGVNDAGLVGALLNATPMRSGEGSAKDRAPPTPRVSRGTVIPRVLEAGTLDGAIELVRAMDLSGMSPFRLWVSDGERHVTGVFDGDGGSRANIDVPDPLEEPVMLVSSGLGDDLVRGPRIDAFRRFMSEGPRLAGQRAFHRWRNGDEDAYGVLMSREEARTVSQEAVDLYSDVAELRHVLLDDALRPAGEVFAQRLELRAWSPGRPFGRRVGA